MSEPGYAGSLPPRSRDNLSDNDKDKDKDKDKDVKKNKLAIGKRNEFAIWGYLLGEGFDVFPSLVDDKGIDGIVGHEGRYFEVQVKSGENWNNQRGLSRAAVGENPKRIFLIYNTSEDQVRYFTGQHILDEPEWQQSIDWKISQIKLPKRLLDKYKSHDWAGFVTYLKTAR